MTTTHPSPETHATAYGIAAALVAALLLMLGGLYVEGFGYVTVLGIPCLVGFLIGHLCATGAIASTVIGYMTLAFALSGIFMGGGGGLLCTMIAAAIMAVPLGVGALVGHSLRRRAPFRRRAQTGALLFLAVAVGMPLESRLTPPHEVETIRTTAVFDASPTEAFDAIVFYESLPFERPLLARALLPRPVRVEGDADRVGAIMHCLYEQGRVTKLVSEWRRGERFAFDVIEQVGIEDRSADLVQGAFDFQELADGRTRVTLASTFRPKLDARAVWRPFERLVCRGMHGQVIQGMEFQLQHSPRARIATRDDRLTAPADARVGPEFGNTSCSARRIANEL